MVSALIVTYLRTGSDCFNFSCSFYVCRVLSNKNFLSVGSTGGPKILIHFLFYINLPLLLYSSLELIGFDDQVAYCHTILNE